MVGVVVQERLTDKVVKSLPLPAGQQKIHYDIEDKGFGVRVMANGTKSFILNYRFEGRERRATIGAYPTWSVAGARERARQLRREIDSGIDPLVERTEAREAKTVADLWKQYREGHLKTKRESSADDDVSMWEREILPALKARKVKDLTHAEIDALHASVSERAPIRANRVIASIRNALNLAIRWGWRSDNPCIGVRQNIEQRRERYLTDAEVSRLVDALDAHPQKASCDAIRLLLLTGARRTEVLHATWGMFDLTEGTWTKPSSHTKQKKSHRVPLSDDAVSLLKQIRQAKRCDVFVFPRSQKIEEGQLAPTPQPLTDIKKTWASVCKKAKLDGVRLHDLRHTFASLSISQNASMSTVGGLLGHTQSSTTARYVHLFDAPMRQAVNAVGAKIAKAQHQKHKPKGDIGG